jgi:two-component sensor histidine kinase
MDKQIKNCPDLTDRDIDLLYQIEAGLPIVADVSRADVLLCCRQSAARARVLCHVEPESISSLYRNNATGRLFTPEEQPLLFRTLRGGGGGSRHRQILSSGAPVVQNIMPIHNAMGTVIGVLLVEMNMIEHERHRRRDRHFRRAVRWLQNMAARGEIENPGALRRFGPYDGIYAVGSDRRILYMSGIATNLFRTIGRFTDMRGRDVSALEEVDALLLDQAFDAHRCVELRNETEDGRIWVRGAIPLHMPPTHWRKQLSNGISRILPSVGDSRHPSNSSGQSVDGALVLLHNATETVQRQRELNVKSAIIQEVHHRVKNNLQTIAAVLRIQARRCESEEARHHLTEAVNRILSMSVIHEFLSQDEHRPINVREVCQRIATQVEQVAVDPEQQVTIRVTGPNTRLPAGQATPTAMVVNELLLNAVEHGLRNRAQGHIEIRLRDLGNSVEIAILDDGNGLPDNFAPNENSSLGLQIVQTLVSDDLKGQLRMEPIPPQHLDNMHEGGVVAGVDGSGVVAEERPAPPPVEQHGDILYKTQAVVTFPKRSLSVA